MPFAERLKNTGESYHDFLKRLRSQEDKAAKYLPENAKHQKNWDEDKGEVMSIDDFIDYESWGWMNSWPESKRIKYEKAIDDGFKFNSFKGRGYWVQYCDELRVYFRVDSSG